MTQISTFVFFDIETTGLPHQEKNRTKITELCLLAVSRKNIEKSDILHPVSKLTLVFNPQRKIHPQAVLMTGLTNEYLKTAPTFAQKCHCMINFLKVLSKPICLVAHNGNRFDYKILLAEFNDAKRTLPDDILCVDTLTGFRKLMNADSKFENSPELSNCSNLDANENIWPELNMELKDWQDIDDMCMLYNIDISCDKEKPVLDEPLETEKLENHMLNKNIIKQNITDDKIKNLQEMRISMIGNIFGVSNKYNKVRKAKNQKVKCNNKPMEKTKVETCLRTVRKGEFTLSAIYKRLLSKEFVNAHRAEGDCFALLECVTAMHHSFLPWIDTACKKLSDITPLIRY